MQPDKKTAYESKLSTQFSICQHTLLFASRMYLENRILKISRLTSGKQFRNEELERRNIKTSEVLQ